MISAVPDERAFRRRFLLTCLLKCQLLLLGLRGGNLRPDAAGCGTAARFWIAIPDGGMLVAEILDGRTDGGRGRHRKETSGERRSVDLGRARLLIDSPSTDPRMRGSYAILVTV